MVFTRRKPDLTLEAFRRKYEDIHVPLIERLPPMYSRYRRHDRIDGLHPPGLARAFDVVTELGFADQSAYERWCERLADPHVIAQTRSDETHFLASSITQMWLTDEHG